MVNRPSVPEIITVNSEDLQTLVRDLLPSQNGFGSELQATNVITPIIDLTATAEGSTLRSDLQTAIAFGSQTAFSTVGATDTIANSPGFYRVFGNASGQNASGAQEAKFNLTDGATTKIIWSMGTSGAISPAVNFDFVVFLAPGESLEAESGGANMTLGGSVRQIADSQGQFVNPSGFPL